MALTVPFWLVAMVFPHAVLGLMLPELVLTGAQLVQFRVFMAILPLLSIIFMSMTFFPAVGKGKPAALIGIARQLVFYVPVMLLVPRFFGVPGIYYGSFAIDAVIVLWTVFMVKGEFAALRRRQAQPA
ncbi:hypothetical protein SDC9_198151 [bioreactor metagenome]|uniref:Multidrug export protein MepA n=1 Tax=bioreactor metagenome TaxID=1076179 RepID=A0A645IQ93_9ZZZZ